MSATLKTDSAHPECHEDIQRMLDPQSVAIVGASDRSFWSRAAYGNLQKLEFKGRVHLINPKGGTIHGQTAAETCAAVGERIDAALLMVPDTALADAIRDAGAAGVSGAVILTAGYAELGEAGRQRQAMLTAAAREAGVRLLGPNCLGFANFDAGSALWTTSLRQSFAEKHIAVVSQSGATASQIAAFAYQQGVGITHLISTGNEADIDVVDAMDAMIVHPKVRVIAMFLETVRRPQAFLDAVERARAAGKPVVVLKVGTSPLVAKAAAAHTGSLVGDARLFDAVCRQYGIVSVASIEDLIVTADLLATVGPIRQGGVAIVGLSGGMCEIAADDADREGLTITTLEPATITRLSATLTDLATPNNPLDITGAAMLKPDLLENALAGIAEDEAVGLVVCLFDAPQRDEPGLSMSFLEHAAAAFALASVPGIMMSHSLTPVGRETRLLLDRIGLAYSGAGIRHGMRGLSALFDDTGLRAARTDLADGLETRPVGEVAALAHLSRFGIPVIPQILVGDEQAAADAARDLGGPLALKVASPDILHKTDAGGVVLGVRGEDEARAAFARIRSSVLTHHPDAAIEGVLVSPMRSGGVELLVGAARDPQWGMAIAVGLGGVLVEALKDVSLRLLPITVDDARAMLAELRGASLLDAFRGRPAVDREALAQAIVSIGDAALALGPSCAAFEVNPLLASSDGVEALDALAVWSEEA